MAGRWLLLPAQQLRTTVRTIQPKQTRLDWRNQHRRGSSGYGLRQSDWRNLRGQRAGLRDEAVATVAVVAKVTVDD